MAGFAECDDLGFAGSDQAALEQLRKNYTIHIYPGADHAFANPSGNAYDAEAAEDAWQKTLEFLDLHLSVDSGAL